MYITRQLQQESQTVMDPEKHSFYSNKNYINAHVTWYSRKILLTVLKKTYRPNRAAWALDEQSNNVSSRWIDDRDGFPLNLDSIIYGGVTNDGMYLCVTQGADVHLFNWQNLFTLTE